MELKLHWDKVKPAWRHIISNIDNGKKERIVYNFNEYFIKPLQASISSSLDWGCGGGLLTKELKKLSKVSVVDISKDSIDNCIRYANPDYKQLIPDNLDEFIWKGDKIDFIMCHALVWHYPSLDYFKQVLKIWSSLKPKYIALI